jgi:hypothetical protein
MPSPAPTGPQNSTNPALNATDSTLPDAENETAEQATNTTESTPMPSPAPAGPQNSTDSALNATDSTLPDAENETAEQATNTTESAPTESNADEPPTSGGDSASDIGLTEGDAQTPTESEPSVEETPGPGEAEGSNIDRMLRVVSELIGNVRQALFG